MDRHAKIEVLENVIFDFLGTNPQEYNATQLVDQFSEQYAPVDIKIAVLNLVNDGRAKLTPSWTVHR